MSGSLLPGGCNIGPQSYKAACEKRPWIDKITVGGSHYIFPYFEVFKKAYSTSKNLLISTKFYNKRG
jgi:hypothetical protein